MQWTCLVCGRHNSDVHISHATINLTRCRVVKTISREQGNFYDRVSKKRTCTLINPIMAPALESPILARLLSNGQNKWFPTNCFVIGHKFYLKINITVKKAKIRDPNQWILKMSNLMLTWIGGKLVSYEKTHFLQVNCNFQLTSMYSHVLEVNVMWMHNILDGQVVCKIWRLECSRDSKVGWPCTC